MYIYMGTFQSRPSESADPLVLVFDRDLTFGAKVWGCLRWSLAPDGQKDALVTYDGTVNREDKANSPTASITLGMFYDDNYPIDFVTDAVDGKRRMRANIFQYPRTDPRCHVIIENVKLERYYSGRTKSPDYNPFRALPPIRYFGPIVWNSMFIVVIAPDNICDGRQLCAIYQDTDGKWWRIFDDIIALDQDAISTTVQLDMVGFRAKMKLGKEEDKLTVLEWGGRSAALARGEDSEKFDAEGNSMLKEDPDYRTAVSTLAEEARPSSRQQIMSIDSAAAGSLEPDEHAAFDRQQVSFAPIIGLTSRIRNDTDRAILCTLQESGSARGKILAGVGMFMGFLGLLPLGPYGMPVGVFGAMLAGTGLLDALNEPEGPKNLLLFPGEEMARESTSGFFTGNGNDLVMTEVKIDRKRLVLRVGVKENLRDDTYRLAPLLADNSLFTELLNISWVGFDKKVIQACKLVKIPSLIPVHNFNRRLLGLSEEVEYGLSDGQLILDNNGEPEALYDTLKGKPPSRGGILFRFDLAQKSNTTLFHANVKDGNRGYDVVNVGSSSEIVVLRISKCRIDGVTDRNRDVLGADASVENGAYWEIRKNAGYYAYSWAARSTVLAYRIGVMSNASIQFTGDPQNVVYIPIAGWLPWQRMVDPQ
jgi:hypothetical protein